MHTNDYTTVLRAIVYLWIAGEFTSLSNLYQFGYDQYKKTPIIYALQRLLTFLGGFFGFVAFLPIIRYLSPEVFEMVINFGVLFAIPIAIYARKFRNESLRRQKMELPNDPKESGTISGKVNK